MSIKLCPQPVVSGVTRLLVSRDYVISLRFLSGFSVVRGKQIDFFRFVYSRLRSLITSKYRESSESRRLAFTVLCHRLIGLCSCVLVAMILLIRRLSFP